MKRLLEFIAKKVAKTNYAKMAVEEKTDLSAFKEKPSPSLVIGVGLIIISMILGWPAVSVLGIIAIYTEEPLFIAIGGPAIYGFSWLVYLAGMVVSGYESSKYLNIFMKWSLRKFLEKHHPNFLEEFSVVEDSSENEPDEDEPDQRPAKALNLEDQGENNSSENSTASTSSNSNSSE